MTKIDHGEGVGDPATWCARAGGYLDETTGAVTPPIQPAATFARDHAYAHRDGHDYGRDDDPTLKHAERVIAGLEGAERCLLFPSGMAAISAWFRSFGAGARIAVPRRGYYGTTGWARRWAQTGGGEARWYDPGDLDSFGAALDGGIDGALVETPANPTWEVTDLKAAAAMTKRAGGSLAVDNTVATPLATRPLSLGADVALHSATKYLNGHADVLIGAACFADKSGPRAEAMAWERRQSGARPSAFDAWLLLRGLRTFPLRFERSCASAQCLAQVLQQDIRIERVLYPGLISHPNHAVAQAQMNGRYSGLLSLLIKGDAEAARATILRLKHFHPATSIGGVESLAEHRFTVEGPESGLPENLIRLSIGLEDPETLLKDLDQALAPLG